MKGMLGVIYCPLQLVLGLILMYVDWEILVNWIDHKGDLFWAFF